MDKKNIIILTIVGLAIIIVLLMIFIVKPFSSSAPTNQQQTFTPPVQQPDSQAIAETPQSQEPAKTPKPILGSREFYVVKEGETLQSISENLYGTNKHWYKIFTTNESEIDWYDTIYVGQKLKLPKLETP